MAKTLFCGLFLVAICGFNCAKHPFYLSLVDIKYDLKQHSLNVSVRMFTNDIEDALKKTAAKPIDLLNPKNKSEMEAELTKYVKKRLALEINSKAVNLDFVGYEKEEDAIWIYFEVKKLDLPKTLIVNTTLLFDFLPQQTNIIHAEVNSIKRSSKVVNPDSRAQFNF